MFELYGDWDQYPKNIKTSGWLYPCYICNGLTSRITTDKQFCLYACKECINKSVREYPGSACRLIENIVADLNYYSFKENF